MSKIHLITFADGGEGYIAGRDLLVKTAKESGWFDTITTYDQKKLSLETPSWHETHKAFINSNRRGFGYWIWKPHIISLRLSQVSDEDLVLYIDSGCQINTRARKRFSIYKDLTDHFDMLCFYLNGPNYSTGQWTKKDLLLRFGVTQSHPLLKQPQVEATVCFFKNNIKTKNHVKDWSKIATEFNYQYVNDAPSIKPNEKHFIENRHDQAIFSLIHYLHGWGKSIKNENYFPHYGANIHTQ